MSYKLAAAGALALVVSGCASSNQYTDSRFASVDASGFVQSDVSSRINVRETDLAGNGFGAQVGLARDVDDGFIGEAGLLPTTTGGPRATASGTYTGRYEVAEAENIQLNGQILTGRTNLTAGTITLDLDTGAGTLTGLDAEIEVNGRVSGTSVTGSVVFKGTEGDLQGVVGQDRAVTVFHGNNSNRIYAGGILAERD